MARLTRYYTNGTHKTFIATELGRIADWGNWNRVNRPGCALFVDGVCVYDGCGYHTDAALSTYAKAEKAEITGANMMVSA